MTRECHVRFCERLGVKLPGATLPACILVVDRIVFYVCDEVQGFFGLQFLAGQCAC
jgi:hypothetical protein